MRRGSNVLPVGQVPVSLGSLSTKVGQMASEQEVVLGGDGEGVAHEGSSVDSQSGGHLAGDTMKRRVSALVLSSISRGGKKREQANSDAIEPVVSNVHLRILLCVHHSRNGNTKVGDRAPEVWDTTLSAIHPAIKTRSRISSNWDIQSQTTSSLFIPHFICWVLLVEADLSVREAARETRGGFSTYGLSRHSPAPCWSGSWR